MSESVGHLGGPDAAVGEEVGDLARGVGAHARNDISQVGKWLVASQSATLNQGMRPMIHVWKAA